MRARRRIPFRGFIIDEECDIVSPHYLRLELSDVRVLLEFSPLRISMAILCGTLGLESAGITCVDQIT
jgi:hypothetical protein